MYFLADTDFLIALWREQVEGIPVLTRNTRAYRRVPGLQIVDFTRA